MGDTPIFNVDLPCACYDDPVECICTQNEKAIRHYASGTYTEPMTVEQREWCVREADWAGEGYYSEDELRSYSDKDLASAVLNAWNMYVQDHF
jgi:hypothetical protein